MIKNDVLTSFYLCSVLQVDFIRDGGTQGVTTTTAAGHEHTVFVKGYTDKNTRKWVFYITRCDDGSQDGGWLKCWDQHPSRMSKLPDQ